MSVKGAIKAKIQGMMNDPLHQKYIIDSLRVLRAKPCLHVNRADGSTYKIPFEDVYCQAFSEDVVTAEDRVATALAWQDVLAGRLVYRFIEVGGLPCQDKDLEGNKTILADMVLQYNAMGVYGLKDADFWGGKQGADGFIEFESPFIDGFEGYALGANGEVSECKGLIETRCSTKFPLEVGYCKPYQIIFHLSTERCVARFPYGHSYIGRLQELSATRLLN